MSVSQYELIGPPQGQITEQQHTVHGDKDRSNDLRHTILAFESYTYTQIFQKASTPGLTLETAGMK